MSALIVKRHVTDGLELARHWRIPRVVADTIPQHHGTRLRRVLLGEGAEGAEEGTPRPGDARGARGRGALPVPRAEAADAARPRSS